MQITIVTDKYQKLEVWKSKPEICVYDDKTKELTFDVNTIASRCWRLVYDGEKFIALIEDQGITMTIWDIFTGTKEECLDGMNIHGWNDNSGDDNVKMAR